MTNYEKNLSAIRELFPDYAKLIEEAPDVVWLTEERAANSTLNLRVIDSSGKTVLVYREDDPTEHSKLLEQVVLHNQKGTLLFGIGVGHGLKALLDLREPKHSIVIIEPVMHMMRLAFREYDFADAIKDGTLFFCPGKAEVEFNLAWLEGHKAIDGWNIIVDHICKMRAEYWQLMDQTMQAHNQTQGNIYTVLSHGPEIARNEIDSLPSLIRHRGVKELARFFPNKPCIIVATGPSLKRNIHIIKEIYDRGTAVIVAVAQALRPLLAYDIRPDFICTVDFGVVNMSHLAGLMDETIPLVTISKTYAPLLRAYRGPKFVSASPLEGAAEGSLYSLMTDCGALMQGGSVLHMAFGLAACLGCDPFILVGADLAYEDQKVSHFGQADSMGKLEVVNGTIFWRVHDPRSTLADKIIMMGEARYVPGYFGEEVLTNAGLESFITTLEAYVLQAKMSVVTVIDATEGGAWIKNTRRMFLRQAIKTYCKEEIDKSVLTPLLTYSSQAEERIGKAIPLLAEEIHNLREIVRWAEMGIRHAKKSLKVWYKPDVAHWLTQNAFCTKQAYGACMKVLPMSYAMNATLRRMDSREFAITKEEEGHSVDDLKVREKGVQRNAILLTAAIENARELEKVYNRTLDILRGHVTGALNPDPLDPIGETEPPTLGDAEKYFAEGNFARPMMDARKLLDKSLGIDEEAARVWQQAADIRNEAIIRAVKQQDADEASGRSLLPLYLDLVEDSKELGRAGNYTDAYKKVEEAIIILPERYEARWGKATLLHKMGKHAEALVEYDWLRGSSENPDRLRSDFEAGQVMMAMESRRAEGKILILSVIEKDPATYGHYENRLD